MKIMLVAINAKYIHSNLAVYSLYSYAREYQKDIVIGEYTINQKNDEIISNIYREKPDVLGFSCYIWNISQILEIAGELHKVLPQVQIWLGGPEVSYDAREVLLKNSFIDVVIQGEGEQTFYELVAHYVDGWNDLADIKGITWRKGDDEIIANEQREQLDLNRLPFVYEQFPPNRIIYYESSRGCPFSCSYCLSSIDKKLRFRDVAIVQKELQYFLDAQVPQVKFVDRTFNCDHEHAMAIWTYLKEHDNGVTNFHFEIAADILNDQEVKLLNSLRGGQVQLEIGVQSVNSQTLKAINRQMDFAKVAQRVREVQKGNNIHQHLDLIVGLPYEDYESFQRSFDAVYELQPGQLQLGFLKVLKGSEMADKAIHYECQYHSHPPYEVLATKWLDYGDILKLKQVEEMVEIYYNSAQFTKAIAQVVPLFTSPFVFYQELGQFYQRRGYASIAHSRMKRYDILLEFLQEIPQIDLAYYQELLLFDLYAREKLKKRPAWAKAELKSKLNKDNMTHLEKFNYDIDSGLMKRLAEPLTIAFDYNNRDALTYNAKYKKVLDIKFE